MDLQCFVLQSGWEAESESGACLEAEPEALLPVRWAWLKSVHSATEVVQRESSAFVRFYSKTWWANVQNRKRNETDEDLKLLRSRRTGEKNQLQEEKPEQVHTPFYLRSEKMVGEEDMSKELLGKSWINRTYL